MAIKIKVCGLCSVEQILALDGMGVDYCGIIFHEPSPRFVEHSINGAGIKNHELNGTLTGVFVNESKERILERIDKYGLTAIQLCGSESPEFCERMKSNATVIKVFYVDESFDNSQLENYQGSCDFFLFDTKTNLHGGSGKKFNWNLLQNIKTATPFFLSGGIAAEDLNSIAAINHPAFYGVDINSRFESSPGNKNIPAIQKFYDQIKSL